ncbi:hypothetical protein Cadr_000005229 [Camelus dromedarius]|uniref:Uncharacterized protein n=1 Tax=Camelus dromedarius TaxID=9838 RepID=A0A5N4E4G8_CAMDR|nr:hypothetical protein Cadr_000005229 [Camelus dromedarius]
MHWKGQIEVKEVLLLVRNEGLLSRGGVRAGTLTPEGARLTHSTHRFWTALTLEMCWSVQHRDGRCRQQELQVTDPHGPSRGAAVGSPC